MPLHGEYHNGLASRPRWDTQNGCSSQQNGRHADRTANGPEPQKILKPNSNYFVLLLKKTKDHYQYFDELFISHYCASIFTFFAILQVIIFTK
jgi:hypothetical protein